MDVTARGGVGASRVNESKGRCYVDWRGLLRRRLPIVAWLPAYTIPTFLQDLLAGFTVGLTEIPQAIAYAIVAGLPPQYGLYSGLLDSVTYFIFGTCRYINIGPTSIMALMAQPHVEKMGPDMAVLMTFLSGVVIFALGLLHLGFLVEFFSYPVIAGFTSAAAIQIASSQIKGLLGLPGKATEFIDAWKALIEHIHDIRLWDTLLGITSIIALLLLRYMKKYGSRTNRPDWSTYRNVAGKIVWFISTANNAVVVIIGTFLAWLLYVDESHPFKLTGPIAEGMPAVKPPPFSTEFNNQTYTFMDMIKQYESSIVFVPLVAILEHVAISKAFAKGKTIDATQELLALGLCNITGSFVRSMPVTGSFTRTAINNASGAQTTLSSLITGCMVLTALGLLTATFFFIPKATLASIVICAMFFLIDFDAVITLWKTKKVDLIPFTVTFVISLVLGLEYGILIGIASNLIFVLHSSARPNIQIEQEKLLQGDAYVVTPSRSLQFPSAEFLKEKVIQECDNLQATVVINGKYIGEIDATVAKNLKSLSEDLQLRNQNVVFWNFKISIINTCIGIDKKLLGLFRDGSLEEIVDDRTPDVIHSIPIVIS